MTNDQRDEMLREIHSHVLMNTEQIKDIRKVMFGNGRPGMCDRVSQVEFRQGQCLEAHAKERETAEKKAEEKEKSLPAWVSNLIALGSLLITGAMLYITIKGRI